MTLPASPPITMAQVRAEFGGVAGTTKLSAYVRGGAYVPNYPANSGVPTAVPIRLAQLCGATATPPLTASAAPASLSRVTKPSGTDTTSACAVTTSGGSGSKTYAWARVSGSASINCTSPSASSTTFSAAFTSGVIYTAVWACTVTDASGSATTNNVSVEIGSNA